MKATALNIVRKKGLFFCMFFMLLFAMETYAQLGGNRRVARRTARRTSNRNTGGGYGYYGGGF